MRITCLCLPIIFLKLFQSYYTFCSHRLNSECTLNLLIKWTVGAVAALQQKKVNQWKNQHFCPLSQPRVKSVLLTDRVSISWEDKSVFPDRGSSQMSFQWPALCIPFSLLFQSECSRLGGMLPVFSGMCFFLMSQWWLLDLPSPVTVRNKEMGQEAFAKGHLNLS